MAIINQQFEFLSHFEENKKLFLKNIKIFLKKFINFMDNAVHGRTIAAHGQNCPRPTISNFKFSTFGLFDIIMDKIARDHSIIEESARLSLK